jgi:hypothetical protein
MVIDSRGTIQTSYSSPYYTVEISGKGRSQYNAQTLNIYTPVLFNVKINGQPAITPSSQKAVIINKSTGGTTPQLTASSTSCSVFICAQSSVISSGIDYQRVLGSQPDTTSFYGLKNTSYPTGSTPKMASFFGNGVSTWNDLNENTPSVTVDQPFAAVISNDSTTSVCSINTTTQNSKTVTGSVTYAFTDWSGLVNPGTYNVTQGWGGQIAMFAIASTKLSTPVERRILQMMGRVWRIHTL